MARLNPSYGSELHLLRMLGRHRAFFRHKVCEATGAADVEWLDFPSGEMRRDKHGNALWDREWEHFHFLPDDDPAQEAWRKAWPTHRTGQNWDAVGRLRYGATREWLLVEAKGNLAELQSPCQAKDLRSRALITETLNRTKAALGASEACDWLQPYYQVCNRLAALRVLNSAGTAARLLYVYFCGDVGDGRRTCPTCEAEWAVELAKLEAHVGLPPDHPLSNRVHKLFIDVRCVGEASL